MFIITLKFNIVKRNNAWNIIMVTTAVNVLTQDYIAWTTTSNMLFFGYKKLQNPLRAVKHENSTGVYDIVAYDTYLQPLSEGVYTSPAPSSLVICECDVQYNIHTSPDAMS